MTPFRLFVGIGVVIVAEAHSNVVHPEDLLNSPCDGGLSFALQEVVGDEGCANPEFGWVADATVPSDAYLKFFVVVGELVFEHGISCLFHGESEECRILV